jgi:xylulose-5-phosphate/fructose-6-phosphate phosphoketolase
MVDKRAEHHDYVRCNGEDLPEVRQWSWPGGRG